VRHFSVQASVSLASLLVSCVDAASVDSADMSLGEESSATEEPAGPVRQGFEDTELGGTPSGWTVGGYGSRTLAVSDEVAARGSRALRIDVAGGQGAVVAMLLRANLGELSEAHHGRIFMRIQGPGASQFVHFDAFEGTGAWDGQRNAVRWAATGTGVGTTRDNWSWIYNVQPSERGEFGREGDRSAHPRVDDWMCLEWRLDGVSQEASFWSDGAAVEYLTLQASAGHRTEIPSFSSLAVGFQKFQQTDGFVVWIDEVAFDRERVGCE
jgi:hypothetical protein